MEIETVRGLFSQFDPGLNVRCSDGNASITSSIGKKELINFARMLLDVADDCITKVNDDRYATVGELINDALHEFSNVK